MSATGARRSSRSDTLDDAALIALGASDDDGTDGVRLSNDDDAERAANGDDDADDSMASKMSGDDDDGDDGMASKMKDHNRFVTACDGV